MKHMMFLTLSALNMLAASHSSFASPFVTESNLNISFDANRSLRYESAKTFFAYGDNTLTVSLQPVTPECPKGRACIQIVPNPVVYELADVSSTKNSCGVVTTIARDDRRPVDGPMVAVKIVDHSSNTCQPSLVNQVRMEFSTEIFSRGMKKPVRTLDKFISMPSGAVYGADLKPDTTERYESASVTVDGRSASVEVILTEVRAPCAKGDVCELLEPTISYELKNARIRTNECGVVQTIAGFDDTPVDGIELVVTINNNLANTCPSFAPLPAIEMVVEQRYYSRLEREVTTVDTFRGENIRFIKPSK